MASSLSAAESPHGTVVRALSQTAGRGQRGNSWESEPGANLTFSMILRPQGLEVKDQFRLSMAVALGVCRVVDELLPGHSVKVKWPNDVYVEQRKICGILIENSLSGKLITRSIVGVGLNVNQREFRSNAPNPVSISMITGKEYNLEQLQERVAAEILAQTGLITDKEEYVLRNMFLSHLWRNDGGLYRWLDTASLKIFEARLTDILPDGALELTDSRGRHRIFHFKEVAAVLY